MIRQSSATNKASQSSFSNSQTNVATAAAAKLLEKKKEFDAVSALERASTLYLERVEGLSDDCDIMADAGQAHGRVLEQWPAMFEILGLFLATRATQDDNSSHESQLHESEFDSQRLVRVPIEELQSEI